MSFLVQPTASPRPKTKNIRAVSIGLAGVFVILAAAQLFTFEEFPKVLEDMWLPGGFRAAFIISAVIVTLEVLALPFLLFMRLSPTMRVLSMVLGWLAVGFWLFLTLWQSMSRDVIASSGLLGATIDVPVGWGNVLLALALAVLAAWTSWGMWPIKDKEK